MSTLPNWQDRMWTFLLTELAAFPGRGNALLRNLVACTLVIVISMSMEVPLLALSLILVFFVSQNNVVLTRMAGILFLVSATVAVAISILLLKYTFGYPLLRILGASAVFIASMFAMRATRLGPLFFLVAIVTIYVQSLVDLNLQPEMLLRACLWVWVAVVYPILVTLLVNTLLLPQEPQQQLRDAMVRQLMQVQRRLQALRDGRPGEDEIVASQVQQGVLALHKLLRFASMRDEYYRTHEAQQLALITCVSRLHAAGASLTEPVQDQLALAALQADCEALAEAVLATPDAPIPALRCESLPTLAPAPLAEMRDALLALAGYTQDAPEVKAPAKEPLLSADAFSNPNYLRFAFKTWLATMLCYVFYSAVDWPGIHTVMLTCVVIALPSLGASTQKGLLRVGGCLVGSALALFCIVFVIPRIDDIVGLLAMSLPVISLGAWVAAGSERISYAGLQIMFCFALALLEQFGPTTELTEIRDRLVGILLGVMVSTLIHGLLWPEREGDSLRRRLAGVLHGIAELLRERQPTAEEQADRLHTASLRGWGQLAETDAMLARVTLEPGWYQGEHEELALLSQTLADRARSLILLVVQLRRRYAAIGTELTSVQRAYLDEWRREAGDWLDGYAATLMGESFDHRTAPPLLPGMESAFDPTLLARIEELRRQLNALPDWQRFDRGALLEGRA
ncbi:FUSC family protein [Pseudomonas sp. LABIM340]|uniref:FUSC family protein n=1 Tax=Pseudomonas sp. LABIM340 TaxID=3156585 RepID=UPI0032AF6098